MDANIRKFLIEASQNEELKKEFLEKLGPQATEATEAIKKLAATVAEFAKEKGYDVGTPAFLSSVAKVEDADLEDIAGGRIFASGLSEVHGDCKCAIGGGGVEDSHQKSCACILGGTGFQKEEDYQWYNDHGNPDFLPLFCVVAGAPSANLV